MIDDNYINGSEDTILSEKVSKKEFTKVKGAFGLGNTMAYDAAQVNKFLSDIMGDIEDLEYQSGEYEKSKSVTNKLYDFYVQNRNIVERYRSEAGENSVEDIPNVRAKEEEEISRMQGHMQEMLSMAEKRADEVEIAAHKEAEMAIEVAKKRASQLISEAEQRAEKAHNDSEIKMEQLDYAREVMEKDVDSIRKEFTMKSLEIENMASQMSTISGKMKSMGNADNKNIA